MIARSWIGRAAVAAAFVLGLSAAAQAATLVTPMLDAGTNEQYDCNVVNAGASPVTVKIELVAMTGDLLAGPFSLTIARGEANRITYPEDEYTHGAFCRFSLEGTKKDIRGSIALFDGTRNTAHAEAR
jgi:hypothetical protein